MTLRKDERPRRRPPKSKWTIPVIVTVAVLVLAYVVVATLVSGQSLI